MLPDFPEIKRDIQMLFMAALRMADAELAPLSGSVPRRRYHEGGGGTLVRADGTRDETDPEECSVVSTYEFDELDSMTLKESFERMKASVAELYGQREELLIKTVKEAAESVGNDFDAGGRELTPDLILEMLDNIQIDFDRDDNPLLPTLVLAPEMINKLDEVLSQTEDEAIREKMIALVEKKRREWHDRESRRKLVD